MGNQNGGLSWCSWSLGGCWWWLWGWAITRQSNAGLNQKPQGEKAAKIKGKVLSIFCCFRSNLHKNHDSEVSKSNLGFSQTRVWRKWESQRDASAEFDQGVWDAANEGVRNNQGVCWQTSKHCQQCEVARRWVFWYKDSPEKSL